MGVLPKCHTSSIKIPSRRTQRYYYDEDNDTPCYKDSLKIERAVSNCCYFLYKYFSRLIQSRHDSRKYSDPNLLSNFRDFQHFLKFSIMIEET
jgi:transcriptional regulator of heat shock response